VLACARDSRDNDLVRCDVHGLAAGPDGACVLCRRSAPPDAATTNATRGVFIVLAVVAVVLVSVGLTYRLVRDRAIVADSNRAIASVVAPVASPSVAPAAAPPATTPDATMQAASKAAALANVRIVVYTTGWCPHCKRAKAWMNANAIRYEERDIDLSREYERQLKALTGKGSIPTFDVEGDVMVGFSEASLLAMRERATARKVAP
jgi:glutaredoxin 3